MSETCGGAASKHINQSGADIARDLRDYLLAQLLGIYVKVNNRTTTSLKPPKVLSNLETKCVQRLLSLFELPKLDHAVAENLYEKLHKCLLQACGTGPEGGWTPKTWSDNDHQLARLFTDTTVHVFGFAIPNDAALEASGRHSPRARCWS